MITSESGLWETIRSTHYLPLGSEMPGHTGDYDNNIWIWTVALSFRLVSWIFGWGFCRREGIVGFYFDQFKPLFKFSMAGKGNGKEKLRVRRRFCLQITHELLQKKPVQGLCPIIGGVPVQDICVGESPLYVNLFICLNVRLDSFNTHTELRSIWSWGIELKDWILSRNIYFSACHFQCHMFASLV